MADAARIHAKEVFDSSKYNALSDMTQASNRETKNVETLEDTKRITNSVKPEQIDGNNKSITTTAACYSISIIVRSRRRNNTENNSDDGRRKSQNYKGSKGGRDTSAFVAIYIIIISVISNWKREEVCPVSQYHAFNRKCCH
jgi:hypothetical protein